MGKEITLTFENPSTGSTAVGKFNEDVVIENALQDIIENGLKLVYNTQNSYGVRVKGENNYVDRAKTFKRAGIKEGTTLEINAKTPVATFDPYRADLEELTRKAASSEVIKSVEEVKPRKVLVCFNLRHIAQLKADGVPVYENAIRALIDVPRDFPARGITITIKDNLCSHHLNPNTKQVCWGIKTNEELYIVVEKLAELIVGSPTVIDVGNAHYNAKIAEWYRKNANLLPLDKRPIFPRPHTIPAPGVVTSLAQGSWQSMSTPKISKGKWAM